MSTPYHVVFVCTGNICRSPMAEWVLRRRLEEAGLADDVRVSSAGTASWHVGQHVDHRTLYALRSNGYECEHRVRVFDPSFFADADLVIALDQANLRSLRALARRDTDVARLRLLREFDPEAGDALDVPDPYDGTSADFADCLRMIEAAMPGLVDAVRTAAGVEPVTA